MKTEKEQLFEIQKHIETQKFNFVSDFFKNYPKKNIYNEELKKLYKEHKNLAKKYFNELALKDIYYIFLQTSDYQPENSVDFFEKEYLKLFSIPLNEQLNDNYQPILHKLAQKHSLDNSYYFDYIVSKYKIDLKNTKFYDSYISTSYSLHNGKKEYFSLQATILSNILVSWPMWSKRLKNFPDIYLIEPQEKDKKTIDYIAERVGFEKLSTNTYYKYFEEIYLF